MTEETPENSQVWVKSIYDAMIDRAIMDVQIAFMGPDSQALWNAVYKLAIVIHEPVASNKKFMDFIEKIDHEVRRKRSEEGLTVFERYYAIPSKINAFKREKAVELWKMIMSELDRTGYLANRTRAQNANPKHIGAEQ